jgi:hypothetical protein
MKFSSRLSGLWLALCFLMAAPFHASAEKDPGRSKVGTLSVTVFYATNGDPNAAGDKPVEVDPEMRKKLSATSELRFTHYRIMGTESKTIFRSYENWAQPLKPSDEILLRFETRAEPTENEVPLDIELWLSRKKILKSDISLKKGEPLYVLGPEWRGGRLIISVELAPKKAS